VGRVVIVEVTQELLVGILLRRVNVTARWGWRCCVGAFCSTASMLGVFKVVEYDGIVRLCCID
jgi:hypothetical protein